MKGNTNSDDINNIKRTVLGQALMQFRNWIPRMADERFGNLRYTGDLQTWEEGKYRSFWAQTVNKNIIPNIFNTLVNGGVLGLGAGYNSKFIELKAKELYFKEKGKNPDMQMTEAEYIEASEFISNHFFMIYPDKDFELNTIFEKTKHLIRKQGVRCLIIDPYNTVEHKMKSGEREDLYISRFMSEIKRFSIENDITTQLVAHQVTPQKDTKGRYLRPDVNRIKGGGTFADKADNVLFVWRPERALDFGIYAYVYKFVYHSK